MKRKRIIIIALLSLMLAIPASAKKRAKPRDIKEFTNPKSLSYVPYPYPKNRREITANLEHYVKKFCSADESTYKGGMPPTEIVFRKLIEPESGYRVGEIVKVKNYNAQVPADYNWLVIIDDSDGLPAMRVGMYATGEIGGAWSTNVASYGNFNKKFLEGLSIYHRKLPTPKQIQKKLKNHHRFQGKQIEFKKTEITNCYCRIASLLSPAWELETTDGTYYYNHDRDELYRVESRLPLYTETESDIKQAKATYKSVRGKLFFYDSVNDQLIVLEKIK